MAGINEKDIEAARAFLRKRVEAELSMSNNAEAVMREAAERIVSICYRYNVNPQKFSLDDNPRLKGDVLEVIEWLREALMEMLYDLAVYADEERKEELWLWVNRERDGATLEQRLDVYLSNFVREMELLVGAGLFLGLAEKVTADSIGRWLKKPWNNPELADGIDAPLTYGRGRTNSMTTAIQTLTRNGVAEAWMRARHLEAMMKEAAGFYTFRNSTYPCSLCDNYAEVFHPMEDETPPLHASCVCGTVYVNHLGEVVRI